MSPEREAVERLKAMEDMTVSAELIAPVLKMNPDVLRKRVRDGDYKLSAVHVSGDRIRFFRKDFLQKIGELPPDEKPTVEQLLEGILEELKLMNKLTLARMDISQRLALEIMNSKENETADSGN